MSQLGGGFNPIAAIFQGQTAQADAAAAQTPQSPQAAQNGQIVWEFPTKGQDVNFAYRDQPPGTTPQCLNVVPYDVTTERARGGQRQGIAKVFSTPLTNSAGSAGPVQQMYQQTFEQIENVVANDVFQYGSGTLLQTGGRFWQTYAGYANDNIVGTIQSVGINTAGGTCTLATIGEYSTTMFSIPSGVEGNVGSIYSVTATSTFSADVGTNETNYTQDFGIGLQLEENTFLSPAITGFTGILARALTGGSGPPYTNPPITFNFLQYSNVSGTRTVTTISTANYSSMTAAGMELGVPAVFQVNANANVLSLEVNGTPILSANVPASSYTGVALTGYQHYASSLTSSPGIKITGFEITTANGSGGELATLLDENFTYGSGSQLQTASGSLWLTSTNGPVGTASNGVVGVVDTSATAWQTTGSSVYAVQKTAYNQTTLPQGGGIWAIYDSSLPIAQLPFYEIDATFTFSGGSGIPSGDAGDFWIVAKAGNPGSATAANALYFRLSCDDAGTAAQCDIYTDGGQHLCGPSNVPSGITGATIPTTMSVQVAADVFSVFVGGTEIISNFQTNYLYSVQGQRRVGFGMAFNSIETGNTLTMSQFSVSNLAPTTGIRTTELIAASNGSIFTANAATFDNSPSWAEVQNGDNCLNAAAQPSIAAADGFAWVVDGTNTIFVNLSTNVATPFVASAGTVPMGAQLACVWHGRLTLGRWTGQEQNWAMSRIGTGIIVNGQDTGYSDFNYGLNPKDPARAFASNTGDAFGRIGEDLVALIPASDDILVFGCTNQMFAMVGDPGNGGVIDHFLHEIGIIGPNAWCFDPIGTMYWMAPSGLYRLMKGYTVPQCISRTVINEYFLTTARQGNSISMVWMQDVHELWMFVTPTTGTGTPALHLIWEERTGGFFPQQFASDAFGPLSAIFYDGNAPQDRRILLGGRDGYIRAYSANALNFNGFSNPNAVTSDDGLAITSNCILGPNRPIDDLTEGKILSLDIYTGMDNPNFQYNLIYTLQAAPDAYNAIYNPLATVTGNPLYTVGHRKDRVRIRGGSMCCNLSNNVLGSAWSIERIVATVVPGAPQR